MPSYVRVIRRGRYNVRVLLSDGTTTLLPISSLSEWTCVGGNVQRVESTNTSNHRSHTGFVNPENQADRIYVSIARHGSRNTSVLLPNGSRVQIPNEYLGTWLRQGTSAYNSWVEETQYVNGRTINDITFGVELEFVANPSKYNDFITAMKEAVGSDRFNDPMCYNIHSTTKWLLKTDSSVHNTRSNMNLRGYELTSPILHWDDASKEELTKVLNVITTVFEGTVNKTCGTHVHIGNFARIQRTESFNNMVQDFQRNYGKHESLVFDRLTSPSRRGDNNRYCQSCNRSHCYDRYFKMNTCNIFGFGTLENRQHQGTLDFQKIWSWVELNGRYMVLYFKDPSLFEGIETSLESFFDKIDLSRESQSFFLAREAELN